MQTPSTSCLENAHTLTTHLVGSGGGPLGRWVAAVVETAARRAAMPNVYSAADAEAPRVLAVLRKILIATHERVLASGGAAKLPRGTPWSIYNTDQVLDLEAEASTSGSDSDEAEDS